MQSHIGIEKLDIFLSYYPLKQGLKLEPEIEAKETEKIFILLSIKTRIETYYSNIYIYIYNRIFILLSIKTRIETGMASCTTRRIPYFYPTIH